MKMKYVKFKGKEFKAENREFHLVNLGIKDIKELEDLENFSDLEVLNLYQNQIEKIDGLDKLKNLQQLNLDYNKITSISGLENLENLKELRICNNLISEIRGIDNLKNLESLYLWDNQITKIYGLENLKNLKRLQLQNNKIKEIEGFDTLNNLEFLVLKNNQISKIKGLENLEKLTVLNLTDNDIPFELIESLGGVGDRRGDAIYPINFIKYCRKEYVLYNGRMFFEYNGELNLGHLGIRDITEIQGLENLKNLKAIILWGNQIEQIQGLESVPNLQKLQFTKNKISEIKNLEKFPNLKELYLGDNEISQIKGLFCLKNLEKLELYQNKIEEIKEIHELSNLKELFLDNNKISKIQCLNSLKNLKFLSLSNNNLEEIEGLKKLTNLTHLFLNHNRISEMKGFENLNKLILLNLANNNISEIKGLENCINVIELNLNNNKIIAIKGLETLSNVQRLYLGQNLIDNKLLEELGGLENNGIIKKPKRLIGYLLLRPIFEKLDKKIEFSDLIKKFPIFEKFSYDELHYICNLFKYVEIQVVGRKIISISTPDSLAQQLDSLMIALDYPLGYKYDFIAQKLKLKNNKAAHRLIAYIIEHDLNSISIIEKEEEVLRGKSPSKKYVDLKVLINTGNIDMDEFILSQLKGKFETLELPDNRKEDFMKVLNFLVNKMIYGRNHRDFIQNQAEKWFEENKDKLKIEMETKFFHPFMREKLKGVFGEDIIDTPSETRGHIDLKLSFTVPLELKVLRDKKELNIEDKILGINLLEDQYLTQIESQIINTRIGFLIGLDFRKNLNRKLTIMPNREYIRFKWISYPQSKSLIVLLIYPANMKTPTER